MDRLNFLKMDEDARMSYYKYKQEVMQSCQKHARSWSKEK